MKHAFLALFLCSSLSACASNEDSPPMNEPDAADADTADADTADADTAGDCTTLTYDNFGEAFFTANCTTCHASDSIDRRGAPLSKNWDTLSNVQEGASRIKIRAGTGTSMPPATAPAFPSADDRAKLTEWIDCGAR
jgi:uncharacterized membrane protein